VRAGVQRLAAHEADVVRVRREEVEPGAEDDLDLRHPRSLASIGPVESPEPVAEQPLDHLDVQRVLRREWCRRLGRRMPTAAAMSFSDVPS
jgi:hypothetical protein